MLQYERSPVLITFLEITPSGFINFFIESVKSAYIQIGAFRKEHVSQSVANDVATKLGTSVEVIPTLVSDPVMYRILVGPEHKDEIIDVIADLMELGISDYFLTHG